MQFVLGRAVIQITPHMRILVAVAPIDFRAGIDALVGACRQRLAADPFGGALFVFGNRARTGIKILVYDGQGFWLCSKRLSQGKFVWKSNASIYRSGSKTLTVTQICHRLLQVLINNGSGVTFANEWRKVIQTPS